MPFRKLLSAALVVLLATAAMPMLTPKAFGEDPVVSEETAGPVAIDVPFTKEPTLAIADQRVSIGKTNYQDVTITFEAANGTPPYRYALKEKPADSRITLTGNTLTVGRDTNSGTYHPTIVVTDAADPSLTCEASFILTVTNVYDERYYALLAELEVIQEQIDACRELAKLVGGGFAETIESYGNVTLPLKRMWNNGYLNGDAIKDVLAAGGIPEAALDLIPPSLDKQQAMEGFHLVSWGYTYQVPSAFEMYYQDVAESWAQDAQGFAALKEAFNAYGELEQFIGSTDFNKIAAPGALHDFLQTLAGRYDAFDASLGALNDSGSLSQEVIKVLPAKAFSLVWGALDLVETRLDDALVAPINALRNPATQAQARELMAEFVVRFYAAVNGCVNGESALDRDVVVEHSRSLDSALFWLAGRVLKLAVLMEQDVVDDPEAIEQGFIDWWVDTVDVDTATLPDVYANIRTAIGTIPDTEIVQPNVLAVTEEDPEIAFSTNHERFFDTIADTLTNMTGDTVVFPVYVATLPEGLRLSKDGVLQVDDYVFARTDADGTALCRVYEIGLEVKTGIAALDAELEATSAGVIAKADIEVPVVLRAVGENPPIVVPPDPAPVDPVDPVDPDPDPDSGDPADPSPSPAPVTDPTPTPGDPTDTGSNGTTTGTLGTAAQDEQPRDNTTTRNIPDPIVPKTSIPETVIKRAAAAILLSASGTGLGTGDFILILGLMVGLGGMGFLRGTSIWKYRPKNPDNPKKGVHLD